MGMMRKHGKHRLHMKPRAAIASNQACEKLAWREHYGKCPEAPYPRSYPCRSLARKAVVTGTARGTPYRCACGSYHVQSFAPNVAAAIAYLVASIRDDRHQTPDDAPVPTAVS